MTVFVITGTCGNFSDKNSSKNAGFTFKKSREIAWKEN